MKKYFSKEFIKKKNKLKAIYYFNREDKCETL